MPGTCWPEPKPFMGHCHEDRRTYHRPEFSAAFHEPSLSPVVVAIDLGWVVSAVMGWPPKEALNPVSSMLGVITGGICGVYGLSTVKAGSGIVERIKTVFQKAA